MNIAEKTLQLKQDFDNVYEAGKKAEYDVFWDAYQINGTRDNYENAFSGKGWTDANFKPKHKIIIAGQYGANGTFRQSLITDLKGILEKQNVELDSSLATHFTNTCQAASYITRLPKFDLLSCKLISNAFGLVKATEMEFHNIQEDCVFTYPFNYCYELVDFKLVNSVIGSNGIDLRWSTKLSADSLKSIINALSTTTTGLAITLPNTAQSNYEAVYGSGSWATLVATRSNWTIAYA